MMSRCLLLATFLLAACGESVTGPAAGLLVTPILAQSQVRAGDTVTVQIVVTNVGNGPQQYSENWCGSPFLIYSAAGTVDASANVGCFSTAQAAIVTLGAGAQHVYTSRWATDYVEAASGTAPGPLVPGTYLIRGALQGDGVQSVAVAMQITQ